MNDCCFVSSLNLPYHKLCGTTFLESFLRYVDPSIWLQLWCDGSIENQPLSTYSIPDGSIGRILRYDLGGSRNVHSFLSQISRHQTDPISSDPSKRLVDLGYDYRKDARTFGLKGMSFAETLMWGGARYVFWVDADTVFKRHLSRPFLISLFGESSMIYFGREHPHSETGFVGLDRAGEGMEEFRRAYTRCWVDGEIFNLSGWTDCHAFDYALEAGKKVGLKAKSLSTQPRGHVIPSSVLGPYLDHRKGRRKFS